MPASMQRTQLSSSSGPGKPSGGKALTRARTAFACASWCSVLLLIMVFLFQFSKQLEGAPREVFSELDIWWIHFQQGFMRGVLNLKDVVFYVAVTYFFLLLSVKTLEAKRWQ